MLPDKLLETARIKFFSHVHLGSCIHLREFSVMIIILDDKRFYSTYIYLQIKHAKINKILL